MNGDEDLKWFIGGSVVALFIICVAISINTAINAASQKEALDKGYVERIDAYGRKYWTKPTEPKAEDN